MLELQPLRLSQPVATGLFPQGAPCMPRWSRCLRAHPRSEVVVGWLGTDRTADLVGRAPQAAKEGDDHIVATVSSCQPGL